MSRDRFEAKLPITMKELGDPEYMLEYVKEMTRTIDLLMQEYKRERAALVRAVTRLHGREQVETVDWKDGYHTAVTDVLALLAARKGRKG